MYGIVNKAIKGLVLENYGEDTWEKVKEKSGVHIDVFLSNKGYDDAITYQLATATSEILKMPLADVLHAFGEYWILRTGMENYGNLMKAGGDNLREFLINLPNFHSRVMLMFPDLEPPEFLVSDLEPTSLRIHYYSHRPGLEEFVRGLLQGLCKMFETQVHIELMESRADGHDHEVFKISW